MIKELHPPSYSRFAEILSRYHPIAPKPNNLPSASAAGDGSLAAGASDGKKNQQLPYLRNLWTQFQDRPTRTHKRGRALAPTLSSSKRYRAMAPAAHASVPSSCQYVFGLSHAVATVTPRGAGVRSLVTLPLLPGSDTSPSTLARVDCQKEEFATTVVAVPEEMDLLLQLQVPCMASHADKTGTGNNNSTPVISPCPVRPVGSNIVIESISEYPAIENPPCLPRKVMEVEAEVELETLPAIISDSNGKVRLANSAYKEMVGQPEFPWLDSVVVTGKSRVTRISGDVILRFCEDTSMTGLAENVSVFRCWVRIEWGNDEAANKTFVKAICDVRRLSCESKDYGLFWRFHTPARSQGHCW